MDEEKNRESAIYYHRHPKPGKISVSPTKQLTSQYDLSLAYSPGVAFACEEIVKDPLNVGTLTARANLVGVITNGTAVLGLGDIGPMAAKPVMEGKAVLFKKFANIDVFDIEINEKDPDRLIDIIASLEPTFGGINLEDIKAPECFYVEKKLRERMKIPVFHDDQHGTAIVVSAAILNALELLGKDIRKIKLVTSGAGAAALACLDILVRLGIPITNIWVTDVHGVVHTERTTGMDPLKERFAQNTKDRTLAEVIVDADIFLGLSAGNILSSEMVKSMANRPLILALANPIPEILPEQVKAARNDAIIATGRSDYPNQVNNVLCFPFIFRGALDIGATSITEEMKMAAVKALGDLAKEEQSEEIKDAYGGQKTYLFGPEYLIPKPFDSRLIVKIAPAVAKAGMDSGVATRPIQDWEKYLQSLNDFIYHSGMIMRPIFSQAKLSKKKVVFSEGDDERVLRAVQVIADEKLAFPILIADPNAVNQKISSLGLRLNRTDDFLIVNKENLLQEFSGEEIEKYKIQDFLDGGGDFHPTLCGSLMVKLGHADALVCGINGQHEIHRSYVEKIIGKRQGVKRFYAINLLMLPEGPLFIGDTYVNYNPSAEELAEMTQMAVQEIRKFGIKPKIALLSHSSLGTTNTESSKKMKQVVKLLNEIYPELEVDGPMDGDAALNEKIRIAHFRNSNLKGTANFLVMPSLDSANISFNLLKVAAGENLTVGPILLGAEKPVSIMTPTATVRRIVNVTALTVV